MVVILCEEREIIFSLNDGRIEDACYEIGFLCLNIDELGLEFTHLIQELANRSGARIYRVPYSSVSLVDHAGHCIGPLIIWELPENFYKIIRLPCVVGIWVEQTSARYGDGLEYIRIWATPPRRLVF